MTYSLTNLAGKAALDRELFMGEPEAVFPRATIYRSVGKRLFDFVITLSSGLLALPVILCMATLVALDGHSPFYSQFRIGFGGRIFRMWKIRTMVPNAESKLKMYLERNSEARLEWETTQKLKNDPRITSIGRFFRKTSMDELPQLFNVLIGDMALVGPRPMLIDQKEIYHGKGYYRLRPGLTGLWQVSDRNSCSFRERVSFDDQYEQELTLTSDLSILWRTVGVVLRGTGY